MTKTIMDDFTVVLRARRFLDDVPLGSLPIPLAAYVEAASRHLGRAIKVKKDGALAPGEDGHTFDLGGKRVIVVNGNDTPERQRFTIAHEIAHIVLDLPTEHHGATTSDGFIRRTPNEVLCDVFAAEILLPFSLLKERVAERALDFDSIDEIAAEFEVSRTATGSRFAFSCDRPCAFVLAHAGVIRHVSRSRSLQEASAWIQPGMPVPEFSLAGHLRRGSTLQGPVEIPAVDWFDDWKRGGLVLEDARYLQRWDHTLSLLAFEDDELPRHSSTEDNKDEEEPALRELDGTLPWPGKSRRR